MRSKAWTSTQDFLSPKLTLHRTAGSAADGERKQQHTAENPRSTFGTPAQREIQAPPVSTWIDGQTSLSLSCLICKMGKSHGCHEGQISRTYIEQPQESETPPNLSILASKSHGCRGGR